VQQTNAWGLKLAPNGPLPATLPEANRAEGNVGERCAAAARTPSPPRYQVTNIQITLYRGRSAGRLLGAGFYRDLLHVLIRTERPTGEVRISK